MHPLVLLILGIVTSSASAAESWEYDPGLYTVRTKDGGPAQVYNQLREAIPDDLINSGTILNIPVVYQNGDAKIPDEEGKPKCRFIRTMDLDKESYEPPPEAPEAPKTDLEKMLQDNADKVQAMPDR